MKRAFVLWLFLIVALLYFQPHSAAEEGDRSQYNRFREQAKEGFVDPVAGAHLFWERGPNWESKNKNFTLRVGGKFIVDTGNIDADEQLDKAFPDLEGYETNFRMATIMGLGRLYKRFNFKLEFDLANAREIQDNWIRFPDIPYLGYLQIGHQKEGFSLEREMSILNRAFMESSLPTQALGTGRNMGIKAFNNALNDRITWSLGVFYNTGSFSDVGNPQDRISEANGFNITARLVGRPWHSADGKRLLHLGLSYSHGSREDDFSDPDNRIRISTQPETRLADVRLADTGRFFSSGLNKINPEFALTIGPYWVQAEGFLHHVDVEGKDLQFLGFYLFSSYFITGENRSYSPLRGVFTGVVPKHDFHPFKGGWGAWEFAARISYLDLNDGPIRGGEELNFTGGINWYLRSNVRMMFNYIRANVQDRENPTVDDGTADILQGRFHVFF